MSVGHAPTIATAALIAFLGTMPGTSLAQEGAPPLVVVVRDPSVVDPDALKEALEADLARQVEVAGEEGEADAVVVISRSEDGILHVEVRREGLDALRRETEVTDRSRTTTTVSLLVANLVRDESVEVLAMIQAGAGPGEGVLTVEVIPSEPEEAEPTLEPAPPTEDAEDRAEASPPPVTIAAGVDFLPFVGVSSAFRGEERRHLSFGALGALEGGIDGVAISGIVDLSLGSVHGVQLAGIHAQGDDVEGVQLGGITAVAFGSMQGLQLGGVAAIATGAVEGLQIAPVNVGAGATVVGMQLGVVNVGGRVHGLQLGVFNFAEEADASIGLFSFQRRADNHLRAEIDSTGFITAAWVHRGRVTYSIVSVGVEPFVEKPTGAFGVGFGARATLTDMLHLDFEGVAHILLDRELSQEGPSWLYDGRVLFGVQITPALAAYLGVGIRTHLETGTPSGLGAPIMIHDDPTASSPRVRVWPMITGGVELF